MKPPTLRKASRRTSRAAPVTAGTDRVRKAGAKFARRALVIMEIEPVAAGIAGKAHASMLQRMIVEQQPGTGRHGFLLTQQGCCQL